jgi:CubicO group peptidase (beta-lactamase class C family)
MTASLYRRELLLGAAAALGTAACGDGVSRPPTAPFVPGACKFPSSAAVVVSRDKPPVLSYCGSVSDDGARSPDQHTLYRIGSITKVLTGMAVLLLRDEGKIGLDDPLEKLVPEATKIHYPSADSPKITIRHVVTHTSGLPRLGSVDYSNPRHPPTEAELLRSLDGLRALTPAGSHELYSNLAVAVLGIGVGRAAGMRYRDYVSSRLLAPLGMTDAIWEPDLAPRERIAAGHDSYGDVVPTADTWHLGAMEAMGGLWLSATDLSRFLAFQLACALGTSDSGPVRAASIRESQTLQLPGVSTFGVGWMILKRPKLGNVLAHTGALSDFSASVLGSIDEGTFVGVLAAIEEPKRVEDDAWARLRGAAFGGKV